MAFSPASSATIRRRSPWIAPLSRAIRFTNGKFDLSDPIPHATTLVGIAHDDHLLGPSTPFTWMTLLSWRATNRTERVLLRWDERQRLWPGSQ
jgi:hypothetical protein